MPRCSVILRRQCHDMVGIMSSKTPRIGVTRSFSAQQPPPSPSPSPSPSFSDGPATSSGWREPSYMVSTEPTVDPRVIKVPILSDVTRSQIFAKFKSNPKNWTVAALAQSYNCSAERIKAVLFLMQTREDMQKEAGVESISQQWRDIYAKHTVDPSKPVSVEALAEEFSLSVEEVGNILSRLSAHYRRQKNAEDADTDRANILSRYAERGVDVRFRETSTAPRKPGLTDNYFPELFGDDGYEAAKQLLLRRVATETKASPTFGMEWFLRREKDVDGAEVETTSIAVRPTTVVNSTSSTLSRCKFALRDLSNPKAKTSIRSRTGMLRIATPLEEARRSWVQNPTDLDLGFFHKQLERFRDPDNDDEVVTRLFENRRVRLQKLVGQASSEAGK